MELVRARGRGRNRDGLLLPFPFPRIKYSCEIKLATASGFFLLSERVSGRASRFRSLSRALDVGLKLFAAYLTTPPMPPPPVQLQLFSPLIPFDKGCRLPDDRGEEAGTVFRWWTNEHTFNQPQSVT